MKNINHLILIIFIQLLVLPAFAQLTFEKAFSKSSTELVALSIDNAEQSNTIVLTSKPSFTSINAFGLVKLNAYGDTVFYKALNHTPDAQAQVVHYGNGHYYVMGIANDTAQQISVNMFWISKFDTNGNLMWTHNYSNNSIEATNSGFGDFEIFQNGKLFCHSGFVPSFFVTDTLGNLLLAKTYNFGPGSTNYLKYKLNRRNSTYYFSLLKYTNFQPPFFARLVKMNENLDTLSTIPLPTDSSNAGIRIIKNDVSKIIMLGFKPIPATIKPYFLTAVDTLGQFLWRKKMLNFRFETTNITSHANLLNGNTVVCGFPYSASQGPISKAFLYCFNNNGDSLWYKEFSPSDSTLKTEFYDVIATSDSGLIASGQMLRANGISESYIVKLDANGNLYNPLKVLEQRQQNYFYVYPNPVNEVVNIHYMGIASGELNLEIQNLQGISVLKSECEIINRSGNWVEVKQTINLGNLPNSIYNCVLKSGLNIIQSKKLVVLH